MIVTKMNVVKAKILCTAMQIPVTHRYAGYLAYKLGTSNGFTHYALQELEWDGAIRRQRIGRKNVITSVNDAAKEEALIYVKEHEKSESKE